jgi:hypothetical protein
MELGRAGAGGRRSAERLPAELLPKHLEQVVLKVWLGQTFNTTKATW